MCIAREMRQVAKIEHYILVALWYVLPMAAKGVVYRHHRKALTHGIRPMRQRFAGLSH